MRLLGFVEIKFGKQLFGGDLFVSNRDALFY